MGSYSFSIAVYHDRRINMVYFEQRGRYQYCNSDEYIEISQESEFKPLQSGFKLSPAARVDVIRVAKYLRGKVCFMLRLTSKLSVTLKRRDWEAELKLF